MNLLLAYKNHLIVCVCCLFFALNSYAAKPSVASNKRFLDSDVIPGELLVKFKQPLTRNKAIAKAGRYKAQSKGRFKSLGIEHWKLNSSQNLRQVIAELKADPNVLLVEPNYRRYPRVISIRNLSSRTFDYPRNDTNLADLNLPKLWQIDETNYRQFNKVKVAVIDDGFFYNHEDLQANTHAPFNALAQTVNETNDPSPQTCYDPGTTTPTYELGHANYTESHGTLVMGVVGAVSNNAKGIDGAADNALMMPIRISCNYGVADEITAFNYAIEQNVNIVNVSWGGPQFSEMERLSIVDMLNKDILIVTAAGNFDADNDRVLDYPSGLDLPNILSVAAINDSKQLTEWSQYGQTKVDIAAPGENIITLSRSGSYVQASGTSFSAPFVAGVAASLLARSPEGTTALDVKAAIMSSAVPFSDGLKARLVTDGYVDAHAAYLALNDPKPLPVISQVIVDDSIGTGNDNGLVDPGEIVTLKITLENAGLKADSISAILTSTTLGFLKTASVNVVPDFDQVNYQYGQVVLEFTGVDFTQYFQSQDVAFELHLTSRYSGDGGVPAKVSRYFTIDTGSLLVGTPIINTIRSNDDNQDEFHYYHVNLDKAQKELKITLTLTDISSGIDLLVNFENPPQFNYDNYDNPKALDKYEIGTKAGEVNGADEVVTITNPSIGTYHIVVIADKEHDESNMEYTLSASAIPRTFSSAAQGCSLGTSPGKTNSIDPLFFLLLIFSLLRINRASQK